jgi:hypothetical protein
MCNGRPSISALTPCYQKMSSRCTSHLYNHKTELTGDRYLKLESSGALQPILNNPDFGATRPVLEDELRDAIESLEASTAAIQKQTETLKFQCARINKQLGLENDIEQQRSRDIARLHKKHEAGRHTTTMAVGTRPSQKVVACC